MQNPNDQVTRVLHVVETGDQSQWLKAERYPSLTSAIGNTDPFQQWHTFRLENVARRLAAYPTKEAWEAA